MYLMWLIAAVIFYSIYINNKTLLYTSLLAAIIYIIFYKKENFINLISNISQKINESPEKLVLVEQELKKDNKNLSFNTLDDIYKDNILNMYFSNLKTSTDEVDTMCNNLPVEYETSFFKYNSLLEFVRKDECRKSFYKNRNLKVVSLRKSDLDNEYIKNEIIRIYSEKYINQGNYIIPVINNGTEYYYQIGKNLYGQPVIEPYIETVNYLGIKLYQNVNTLLFYKVMNA